MDLSVGNQNKVDYKSLSLEELQELAILDTEAWFELTRREELIEKSDPRFDDDMFFEDDYDDDDDEDELTHVWYTESPMGHNAWE